MHAHLRLLLLLTLLWPLGACGSKTYLRGYDLPLADTGVLPEASMDARGDAPPGSEVVTAICPAALFGVQTETATIPGGGTSSRGNPLTFAWTVERRPMGSTSTPTPPNAANTQLQYDTGGEWVLRLTVTSSSGLSDSCTARLTAQPAIEVLCPNDQSNYQGATLPLVAMATSRFNRPMTYTWATEARPMGSTFGPTPPDQLATNVTLDQLGDYSLVFTARDSSGLMASCRTRLHADPDVIVQCPPDTTSTPFQTIQLAAQASSRLGLPLTYRWEIVEQPVTSTASLAVNNQLRVPFTFDVAGNWTYRFTATNPRGNMAFCTTRARAASAEAVRVELVWNVDRACSGCNAQGGGQDLDLHLTDVARSNGHWASGASGDSDCYYANCKCNDPGMTCPNGILEWGSVGPTDNPQLDVDHISDLPGPENINILRASVGRQYDVGVHFYSSHGDTTPVSATVVRVYCAGNLVFESEVVRFQESSGGGGSNNLWRVGRITVNGGGCLFERCGTPGNLASCVRPENSW